MNNKAALSTVAAMAKLNNSYGDNARKILLNETIRHEILNELINIEAGKVHKKTAFSIINDLLRIFCAGDKSSPDFYSFLASRLAEAKGDYDLDTDKAVEYRFFSCLSDNTSAADKSAQVNILKNCMFDHLENRNILALYVYTFLYQETITLKHLGEILGYKVTNAALDNGRASLKMYITAA